MVQKCLLSILSKRVLLKSELAVEMSITLRSACIHSCISSGFAAWMKTSCPGLLSAMQCFFIVDSSSVMSHVSTIEPFAAEFSPSSM